MTARSQGGTRPAPRVVLRVAWVLHRSLCRVTGGRMGLTRPEAGTRFGMLRLTTVGRRSGERRVAIIGYYPDGGSLVTLAMNGWGDTEPAWWLNLRGRPEATVETRDGRWQVRAREATGAERDRLWAGFHAHPGWGDIQALAACRARPTAVVVLEPDGPDRGRGTVTC